MKQFIKNINWLTFFSFALLGLLIYSFDSLYKKGVPLPYNNKNNFRVDLIVQFKNPIEIAFPNSNTSNSFGLNNTDSSQEEAVYYQTIPECSCSRKFMYPPFTVPNSAESEFPRFNSSCSDQGTFYQNNQKVVTFCVYVSRITNKRSKYDEGLIQNLSMMRKYYPGYSLRVYTDRTPAETHNCALLCNNEDLFWCNVKGTPSHGDLSGMVFRTWRFLPLGDPTVDVFLSRDLDSLIFGREADAVNDWLSKGDKAISLMRDRPRGHNVSMLAGMWQASNKMLGMDLAGNLRERIIEISKLPNETYKTSDQDILEWTLFKTERENIVAYDSYNCVKWANYTLVRPYPTQRLDPSVDFVANRVDFLGTNERKNYSVFECPIECRPTYGKTWTYC